MDKIRVLSTALHFPEGPTFDESGCIWCAEQEKEGFFCRYPNGSTRRVHTGGRPGGAVVQQGHLWFCDSVQNAIRRINLETGEINTVISEVGGKPLNHPNALQFDDRDNLIFTCPGCHDEEQGYVVVRTPGGLVDVLAEGLDNPNGLAFFPNAQTLLISESCRQRIWQGFWNADELSWETLWVWTHLDGVSAETPAPGPDGMAIGPDGNLYVVIFELGIIRVLSAGGEFVRDISLPGKNPTGCTFDPSGELGLVVTESKQGELLSIVF